MKKQAFRGAALLKTLPAHLAVILSLMYLVPFVIDRINNAMEFINNDITKTLLAILALLSIANGLSLMLASRRRLKKQVEKQGKNRQTVVRVRKNQG
jgi:hypothetical protein